MRMMPSQPNDKLTYTERKVFDVLSGVEWHPGAACLSSLNLAEHEYKAWGEADFVIIGRGGLMVIEVKGGAVSCNEGIWRYESMRYGPVVRRESPFAQANGAFHALALKLTEKFGNSLGVIGGGFAVVFASMTRRQMHSIAGGPETPDELTGYSDDLTSPEAFRAFMTRVERHWNERARAATHEWLPDECAKVIQFVRPNFERVPPLSLRVAQARDERLQLTEGQYYALDRMDACDRLLVTASAGCGKTLLAVEAARREASAGRRVALVTGTEHLASFLREGSDIGAVASVHSYREFTDQAGVVRPHDVLIIDEGQQITTRHCLDRLEPHLSGGIEGGRWRWFSDPNRQVAFDSAFDDDTMELLRMLANHEVPLLDNCRNTEQVVAWAEQVSGVQIGRPLVRGRGQKVVLEKERTKAQLVDAAARHLVKLLQMDARTEDIVVLWEGERGREDAEAACTAAGLIPVPWPDVFRRRGLASAREVALSSVVDFRGLEAEHVFLLGLEEDTGLNELRRTLYLAVTRATFSVNVFVLPDTYRRIQGLIEEGLTLQLNRRR